MNNTSWQFIIKKGLQNLWLCQNSEKFELNLLQMCFHSICCISSAFQLGLLQLANLWKKIDFGEQ